MTLLLELAEWIWEHPGEITINAILLLILRKFIMSEVHKLLHLGREGELQWIRERVEQLTGERYSGHEDFLKTVRIRYIRKFYFYLLVEVIRKRKRRIYMDNIKWTTLLPGVISAAKLVLQSFGIDIPDEHINAIVNGAAAVGAVVAIFMSHRKQGGATNAQYKGDTGSAI